MCPPPLFSAAVKSVVELDPFDSYAKTPMINSWLGWYFVRHFLILPTWKLGDLIIGQKKGREDKFVLIQRLRVPRMITVTRGEFDSVDTAVKFAEAYIASKLGYEGMKPLARGSPWLKKPASERQVGFLQKLGFTFRDDEEVTMGRAQYLISAKFLKNFALLDPIKEDLLLPGRQKTVSGPSPRDQMMINALADEEEHRELEEKTE